MLFKIIPIILLQLWIQTSLSGWAIENYPNPTKNPSACGMKYASSICDPDHLLTEKTKNDLFDMIESIKNDVENKNCPDGKWEVAVGLADSVDANFIGSQGGKESAIKALAKGLHDKWGVGDARCQTGIVLFLSKAQRYMYFSTGAGAKSVLKNHYIDQIIDRMKDKLRGRDFDGAVIQSMEDVTRVLKEGYVVDNTFEYICYGLLGTFTLLYMYSSYRKKQKYNEAKRRLTEMQKAEAQRLEENFDIESCMVCFEEFPPPGVERDQKSRLLRCGHRFCRQCINSWEEQGHHTCPLCRKNMYEDEDDNNDPRQPMNRGNRSGNTDEWEDCSARSTHYNTYRQELRRHRFRRLNYLYPNFVTHSLIDTWSRPDYRGTYANHSGFRGVDPSRDSGRSRSGGSSSSFGGGSSSGGSGSGGGW